MSRFKVTVMSDEPMKAWERLDRAGVPTLGPAYAEFVGSPESGTLSRCMTAVLDADNPDEAVTHVRQAVGEIGEVGAAAPLDHRGQRPPSDAASVAAHSVTLRIRSVSKLTVWGGVVATVHHPLTQQIHDHNFWVLEAVGLSEQAMSQENVEVVRRVYDAWNAGDMTALRDLCDPDVVMHHPEGWPEPGPSVGREAVLRQWEQVRDAWTGDTLEPVTDFSAAADRVVVRDAWRGTGQGPDADMEFSRVFTLRERKIIGVEIFWDHAEALEALGLSEQRLLVVDRRAGRRPMDERSSGVARGHGHQGRGGSGGLSVGPTGTRLRIRRRSK